MLSLLSLWRAKSPMRNVQNRGFKTLCPVFSLVVFEKSEVLWSGSLMGGVSTSTEVILSNSLGSHYLWGGRTWPGSQNCSSSCGVRLTRAFGPGKFGRIVWTGASVELVSKWPCRNSKRRRVKHERNQERRHAHATNIFFMTLSHACVTRMKMCEVRSERAVRRKSASNMWVCVHLQSHTK